LNWWGCLLLAQSGSALGLVLCPLSTLNPTLPGNSHGSTDNRPICAVHHLTLATLAG
jgi:hypothetical protein